MIRINKLVTTLKKHLNNLKTNFIPNAIESFKTCSKYGGINQYRNIYFLSNTSYDSTVNRPILHYYVLKLFKINMSTLHINELINERSPYLLQHAKNPVNWYPWCPRAINKAKDENKLIFLSVGYSTCHWCHVMERESFENEDIATVMNENFINIKVDREERPDIDTIYMKFVQLVSGSGGWPMSVFLTPDLKPVSGGTYFPPEDRYGRPGFKTLLQRISQQWRDNPEDLKQIGEKVINLLEKVSTFEVSMVESLTKGAVPEDECSRLCYHQLSRHFDEEFGGFDFAPKFPQPCNLLFLLNFYTCDFNGVQNKSALNMANKTLVMMAKGGIHDHIGQGFSRYSTDEKWHVPHFEKMLYDQAQLACAYTAAYLLTNKKIYKDIINDILTYVNRDLSHKDGGFYCAEDADSFPSEENTEKREGAFYVWTYNEIADLLSRPLNCNPNIQLSDLFCHHYNVMPNGNVNERNDPHGEFLNKNVLIVFGNESETAKKFGILEDNVTEELQRARSILFEERNKRPRPHLDTKIITAWNGLMLSAYAKAAVALHNDDYKERAIKAATFIKTNLWKNNCELLHCCYVDDNKQNIVQSPNPIPAFLNDYAFLIRGLLDLYECTYDANWIEWSEILQDKQDELFWDTKFKAYNLNSGKDKSVLLQLKDDHDGAEPSGNSVAVSNLLRLSYLLEDRKDYGEKTTQILSVFTSRLTGSPSSLPEMVCALMSYYHTPIQIFIVQNDDQENANKMLKTVHEFYQPNRILILITKNSNNILYRKSETYRNMVLESGTTASAHVCRNQTCSMPVTTVEDLKKLLR